MRSKLGTLHPRAYDSWRCMLARCRNPKREQFRHYGGRGITVCARWHSFPAFLADMGDPAPGFTLERRKTSQGYTPENCRWASRKEQSNNRRSNLAITFNGRTQNATQWAEHFGLKPGTIQKRLRRGWPVNADLFRQP